MAKDKSYASRRSITEILEKDDRYEIRTLAKLEYTENTEPISVQLYNDNRSEMACINIADLLAVADWLRERGKK